MPISGRLGMSGLDSSAASVMRAASEPLTLTQEAAGTFNAATQTTTPGAATDLALYGMVALIEEGLDGVTVQRGDLDVWVPFLLLDDAGTTLRIGDRIKRDKTSDVLTVLRVQLDAIFGVYRAMARVAS